MINRTIEFSTASLKSYVKRHSDVLCTADLVTEYINSIIETLYTLHHMDVITWDEYQELKKFVQAVAICRVADIEMEAEA